MAAPEANNHGVRTARLGRARLRRAGKGGVDATTLAGWGAALLLLGAVGGWAWAFFRPLDENASPLATDRPPAATLLARDGTVDARKARIAGMGQGNAFSLGRKAWPSARAEDGAEAAKAAPPVLAGGDVPADVKPALDNLLLQGVFESGGSRRAMIGFVNDPKGGVTQKESDDFTDKAFPQAPWRLVSIDMRAKTAVLLRGGRQYSLAMFRNVPVIVEPPRPGEKKPAAVAKMSRADAIKALRDANVSEAEIQQMLEIADAANKPKPIEPDGKATAEAMKKALGDGKEAEQAPPPGFESVLKMMGSGAPPAGMQGAGQRPQRNRPPGTPPPGYAPAPAPAPSTPPANSPSAG